MKRILFLTLLVSLAACMPAQGAYVGVSGENLTLNGSPYKFRGLNDYNLNSDGNCNYVANDSLDFSQSGANVVRAWFFQPMASGPFGARDWTRFDQTIAAAKAAGVLLLPVLGDEWQTACDGNHPVRDAAWYTFGYDHLPTSPGMSKTMLGWIDEVVARYKDEPTIAAWMVMNEAETNGDCSAAGATLLRNAAASMTSHAQSADPNHLIFFGVLGKNQCGVAGSYYKDLHALPSIDACSYHDYSFPNDPIPTGPSLLSERIQQCHELGKPLIVDEVGIDTPNNSLSQRATLFANKWAAQDGAGIDGFLCWLWRDTAHGGSSTSGMSIGPSDPALATC